jgi:hypothetical protein
MSDESGPFGPCGQAAIRLTETSVDGHRWLKATNRGFLCPVSEIARVEDYGGLYEGVTQVTLKTGDFSLYVATETLPGDLSPLAE